jgi:O-antigen ligase
VLVTDLFRTRKQIACLINIIMLSMIIPCIVGFYQFITNIDKFNFIGTYRISGTFTYSNIFGFYMVLILPLVVTLFLHYPKFTLKKFGLGILCLMMITALFLTLSRGSWIGIATAILVISILKYRKLLIISIIFLIIFSPIIAIRFQEMSAFMARIILWEAGFNLFVNNPILGIGLGGFESSITIIKIAGTSTHPHNEYLRFAVETGVFGLGAFLWMLINLIRNMVNIYKKTLCPYFQSIMLGVIAIFSSYIIMCMNESMYRIPGFIWVFYTLAAIPYIISNMKEEERKVK